MYQETTIKYRHFAIVIYHNGGQLPHTRKTYKAEVYGWDNLRRGTYPTIEDAKAHVDSYWDAFEAAYVAADKAKMGA